MVTIYRTKSSISGMEFAQWAMQHPPEFIGEHDGTMRIAKRIRCWTNIFDEG
jgi:hypothetical protein